MVIRPRPLKPRFFLVSITPEDVVTNDNHAATLLSSYAARQTYHLAAHVTVEVRGRLVGQV